MSHYRRTTCNLKFTTSTKQKICSVCRVHIPPQIPFLISIDYRGNPTAKQFRMCFYCINELVEQHRSMYDRVDKEIKEKFQTERFVKQL